MLEVQVYDTCFDWADVMKNYVEQKKLDSWTESMNDLWLAFELYIIYFLLWNITIDPKVQYRTVQLTQNMLHLLLRGFKVFIVTLYDTNLSL